MNEEITREIRMVFDLNCITYTEAQIDKLAQLTELFTEANKKMNLTAIKDTYGIALKHYADSLTALPHLPDSGCVIDVGCGGGFPTFPLAIFRPDLKFTALDSTAKKLTFVKSAAESLSLTNISICTGRAEEIAHSDMREKYDAAISRAVARMNVLTELCMGLVKANGIFIAMKGSGADDECEEAKLAIKKNGGADAELRKLILKSDNESEQRTIITVKKKSAAPEIYPRAFAVITKRPL